MSGCLPGANWINPPARRFLVPEPSSVEARLPSGAPPHAPDCFSILGCWRLIREVFVFQYDPAGLFFSDKRALVEL